MRSISCLLSFIFALLLSNLIVAQEFDNMQLVSKRTTSKIKLDASKEDVWNTAKKFKIKLMDAVYQPSNGYKGMDSTQVEIQSLHDDKYVYFYIVYSDPTKSLARFPWVKQDNKTWKQLKKKDSTGHDNSYYEDKVGMYWNINSKKFKQQGCAMSCHMSVYGKVNDIKDGSAGRKYTNNPGETIDMWHWKSVRTGPLGMMDDQFVDSTNNPKANKNWGRKGDHKKGGGYSNNINKAKNAPAFMNKKQNKNNQYWITPSQKTKFVDTFKKGDIVPGIMISPFKGSRADISVESKWAKGYWNLEIKRKLVTGGKNSKVEDVQFSDLSKKYHFGISVFDNTQINHLYHLDSIEFSFATK